MSQAHAHVLAMRGLQVSHRGSYLELRLSSFHMQQTRCGRCKPLLTEATKTKGGCFAQPASTPNFGLQGSKKGSSAYCVHSEPRLTRFTRVRKGQSTRLFVCLPVCLPICLSVCLPTCLSVMFCSVCSVPLLFLNRRRPQIQAFKTYKQNLVLIAGAANHS